VPLLSSDVGVNKFENIKIEVPAWHKHEMFVEGSRAAQFDYFYRTRYRDDPQNKLDCGKKTDFWYLVLLEKNILFMESPPSIMVTRNPNWSTEIL
jgi:hypothetical protein